MARVGVVASVGSELFQDVGDVRREDRLGDVVGVSDFLAGVAELRRGGLGVGLLVDQCGDGLAERMRGDPFEICVGAGLSPLAADVVR